MVATLPHGEDPAARLLGNSGPVNGQGGPNLTHLNGQAFEAELTNVPPSADTPTGLAEVSDLPPANEDPTEGTGEEEPTVIAPATYEAIDIVDEQSRQAKEELNSNVWDAVQAVTDGLAESLESSGSAENDD